GRQPVDERVGAERVVVVDARPVDEHGAPRQDARQRGVLREQRGTELTETRLRTLLRVGAHRLFGGREESHARHHASQLRARRTTASTAARTSSGEPPARPAASPAAKALSGAAGRATPAATSRARSRTRT